jgi:hypothetical protein
MKKRFSGYLAIVMCLSCNIVFSQTASDTALLHLPGDNLDLYAVLNLFQKSKTIEAFEKSLNEEKTGINNLDLDLDKKVDFIKVVTKKKDSSFSFILQVHVTEKEVQDVAVILLDKDKKGKVTVQIVGDKELYGPNYVVEPAAQASVTPNPGYVGKDPVTVVTVPAPTTTVIVEQAPIVQYVYSPAYVPYYPPYHYGYYPAYFAAFTIMAVGIYHHNHYGYHGGYGYHNTTVIHNENNFNNYNGNRNNSDRVSHNNREGNYGNRGSNRPSNGAGGAGGANRPSTQPSNRPSGGAGGPSASTRPSTSDRSAGGGGFSGADRPSTADRSSGGSNRSSSNYGGSSGRTRSSSGGGGFSGGGGGGFRGGGGGGGRRR